MTYTLTSDIAYTASKSQIKQFAMQHGCNLSSFQKNGPGGGNHVVTFTSKNLNHIQDLCDQLNLPYSKIISQ